MSDESNALREKVESHIKWRAERFFGSNDTKTEPLLRDMLAIITALEVEVTWHESDHAAALAQIESLTRDEQAAQRRYIEKCLAYDTLRAELDAAEVALRRIRSLAEKNAYMSRDIANEYLNTARSRGETGAAK